MTDDTISRRHQFQIAPDALIADATISDRAVRLWLRLSRYAGHRGVAFPSRRTIAEALNCSTDSIDRAVRELVDSGWLTKSRPQPDGVCHYVLESGIAEGGSARVRQGGSAPVRQGLRTGADSEEEALKKNVPSKKERKPRTTNPVPESLPISDKNRKWAEAEGIPLEQMERTAKRLLDYCLARGKAYKDYDAALRNWVTDDRKRNGVPVATATDNRQAIADYLRTHPISLESPPWDLEVGTPAYAEWHRGAVERRDEKVLQLLGRRSA